MKSGLLKKAVKEKPMDMVDKIMAYEGGEMSGDAIVDFFAELVKSGDAWKLQGCYGRMAASLIDAGYISKDGLVVKYPEDN